MTPIIRLIFCGTSQFAVPSLEALIKNKNFQVDMVITQPDRPAGRKQTPAPPPVKTCALEAGIRILQPQSINAELKTLQDLPQPDFLVVISYGQILSDGVLAIPSIAPINVHASLLPRLRGASPIQHAILEHEEITGISVQRMVSALDAGSLYATAEIPIGSRETFSSLHDRLAAAAAPLLIQTLTSLPEEIPQDESLATVCKKLSRESGAVDPETMTADEIDLRVRALSPWPGVAINGLKILRASLVPEDDTLPLPCTRGTVLYLKRVQPAGRKPMSGAEYARGRLGS